MRLLEYRQELVDQGYTVSSVDMHYEDSWQNLPEKITPIRMVIPEAKRNKFLLDYLIANCLEFGWDSSRGTESEYRERYGNILREESPEWKIFSFSVSFGVIGLDIVSEKTHEKVYLCINRPPVDLTVQFKVPSLRGSAVYTYFVIMEHNYAGNGISSTRVIEDFFSERRNIEFLPRIDDSQPQRVIVREFTQF